MPGPNVIDWAATGSMLQGIGNFAQAGAIIFAAIVGARWLQQRREERRFMISEQILASVYKIKDVLSMIRSPLMLAGEIRTSREKLGRDPDGTAANREEKRQETAQIIYSRMTFSADSWDSIIDTIPLARAYFGDEIENLLRRIVHLRQKVWASVMTYGGEGHLTRQEESQFEADFWEGWGRAAFGADRIVDELNEITKELETQIQPLVRPRK